MRTAIAGSLAAMSLAFAPAAFAGPTGSLYTIGGDISILITWGPGDCIRLNWPTASEPICNEAHAYVGHQYNVLPGQVIGVDPQVISLSPAASWTMPRGKSCGGIRACSATGTTSIASQTHTVETLKAKGSSSGGEW